MHNDFFSADFDPVTLLFRELPAESKGKPRTFDDDASINGAQTPPASTSTARASSRSWQQCAHVFCGNIRELTCRIQVDRKLSALVLDHHESFVQELAVIMVYQHIMNTNLLRDRGLARCMSNWS